MQEKRMRIIQIHNLHRFRGGSDIVAMETGDLLRRRGHEVLFLTKDSRSLGKGFVGKLRAFLSGLYSHSSRKMIRKSILEFRPHLVHVHDLYPFFSPWILLDCKRAGVPVVMTSHDYRMTCPTGFHFHGRQVCDSCSGGHEYWCVLKNCRGNIFESVAYAVRNMLSRRLRLFHNNVTLFVALTEFSKKRLVEAGFAEQRISILPNMVTVPDLKVYPSGGKCALYIGRISPEKSVETLMAAARGTGLSILVAGDYSEMPNLLDTAPPNVKFVGLLNHDRVSEFYAMGQFLVVPSTWFEGCPMVILEAMGHSLPIIASRIGGIPELVEDGVTGLLFEPGNSADLMAKMQLLSKNTDLCHEMGKAGRERVIRKYSEDAYYGGIISVYQSATEICKGKQLL